MLIGLGRIDDFGSENGIGFRLGVSRCRREQGETASSPVRQVRRHLTPARIHAVSSQLPPLLSFH